MAVADRQDPKLAIGQAVAGPAAGDGARRHRGR